MTETNLISEIATRILESEPDPVVRLRLQRDVFHTPTSELFPVINELNANPWVDQLVAEQHPDGGWGCFHFRDSQSQQKITTTEFGVARGLALGLDASHPIFCRTVDYLTQLLLGTIEFPDPPEGNNRWLTGVQLFVAATLAQLKPNHPFVDQAWELWAEIAARTFKTGEYDAEAEIQAHQELTGATVKDSYLLLNNKYTLILLSARLADLPDELTKCLLHWVWKHPQGVGYIGVPITNLPADLSPGGVDRWFKTHELLSRYPAWKNLGGETVAWLWDQQSMDGLWDFGSRAQGSYFFPLSASWRKAQNRKFDWTTRILLLLAKFAE
jgi:hypothetical protein